MAARRDETLSPISTMAVGGGPMNATPAVGDGAGEVGVLREEAVAGVHAVGAALGDGVEDGLGVEVALGRGLPAERVRLVGQPDVEGVPIELGVHGDGADAELRQARMTRTAISPRLAIRIFWSIEVVCWCGEPSGRHPVFDGRVAGALPVTWVEETGSTNADLARARPGRARRHGTVLVADHQTAGSRTPGPDLVGAARGARCCARSCCARRPAAVLHGGGLGGGAAPRRPRSARSPAWRPSSSGPTT